MTDPDRQEPVCTCLNFSEGRIDPECPVHRPDPDRQERWTVYVCERHGRVEPWYEGPSSPRAGEPRCAACVNEADHVSDVAPLVPTEVVPVIPSQDGLVWTIHELTPGPDPGSLASVIIEGPAVSMDGEPVEVVPLSRALTAEQRVKKLEEAADLARHWFENFNRKPAHEGIDVSGVQTVLAKLRAALTESEES